MSAFGFRRISRVQNGTQPVWLLLQLAPLLFIIQQGPAAVALWTGYNGNSDGLDKVITGLALAVFLSLLPQIGEQVDYLRFLPRRETVGNARWWSALLDRKSTRLNSRH